MLPSWAYGSAVVLNSEYSTQLYVFFETFGGSSEFGFLCANTDYTAENSVNSPYLQYENYRVADTDYENYSVVLSCIPAGEVNYISNRPVSRVVWHRGSTMSHVTYIIMSGIAMEYLGPNMTPTWRHVTLKNVIFCQKMTSKSEIRPKHIDIMRHKSRDLDEY